MKHIVLLNPVVKECLSFTAALFCNYLKSLFSTIRWTELSGLLRLGLFFMSLQPAGAHEMHPSLIKLCRLKASLIEFQIWVLTEPLPGP